MKSIERILHLLKRDGRLSSKTLAQYLQITPMGARQHLSKLKQDGLITFEDVKAKIGRPTRVWYLTSKGHEKFIDRHNDLTLDMFDAIIQTFGQSGLDKLTQNREQKLVVYYQQAISNSKSVTEALSDFVLLRDREGYMTELKETENGFLFIENHCPIHKAANYCANLCQSELSVLQHLFGEHYEITREEHILKNQKRCTYRFIEKQPYQSN